MESRCLYAFSSITTIQIFLKFSKLRGLLYVISKTQTYCLDKKYFKSWNEWSIFRIIRSETLINQKIDPNWLPILQTPTFPEYTSGHSVVSGAASVILIDIFGDDFYFEDDTELLFGLPVRNFKSFYNASSEAAIGRLYGGIHYPAAIVNGLKQGKDLGYFEAKKLKL